MNVWLIVSIVAIVVCTFIFVVRIIKVVKLVKVCRREGVKKVKLRVNIGFILLAAVTAWILWLTVSSFIKANETR